MMLRDESMYLPAAALLWISATLRSAAVRVLILANRLHRWLERRRVAAAALHDFATMGERELQDIGLSRVDVHRVAWGASDRDSRSPAGTNHYNPNGAFDA
jgi:uncharacterized protein YjiS (DUF1127 family)